MSGVLAALGAALALGAGVFGVRLLTARRVARRLEDEEAAAQPLDRSRSIPPLAPALVVAGIGTGVAHFAFGISIPIGAAIGFDVGALTYVAFAQRSRALELRAEGQLGDALASMTSAVRAGASPNEALQRAAAPLAAPIGPRLRDAAGRLRLGEPPGQVLGVLGRGSRSDSLRLFCQALAIQWRAGGSLEHTLGSVARYVRDRVEVQRRIESQAAPTRASVLVLAGATLAVAFLSWANDPINMERFVASSMGQLGVTGCFVLQGISFLWMWRIGQVQA